MTVLLIVPLRLVLLNIMKGVPLFSLTDACNMFRVVRCSNARFIDADLANDNPCNCGLLTTILDIGFDVSAASMPIMFVGSLVLRSSPVKHNAASGARVVGPIMMA